MRMSSILVHPITFVHLQYDFLLCRVPEEWFLARRFALSPEKWVYVIFLFTHIPFWQLTCRLPAYFTSKSPDFINGRGRAISAHDQVDALGQAQSIVYLSIFITQCFNVCIFSRLLNFPQKYSIGLCRESTANIPLWTACCLQQMEFCWNSCRRLLGHVHCIHTATPRRVRRFSPAFAFVLVDSIRFRIPPSGLGLVQGGIAQEVGRAFES